ncbi:MAG: DUF4384 domain-containing protein [Deltaproteobacteria bacterium]|nr:DUF4384 domain-containing protein [Deltaproteobacteria bacterium]
MPVYILLDDGTQAQVELSDMAHIPAPGDPVQIVSLMGKLSHDVEESLLRAKCAALQFLVSHHLVDSTQGFSLAVEIFDRQGQPLAHKVRGPSGGLAFALALILHKARWIPQKIEICATGRLGNPRTQGVRGVGAIAGKITGALSQLAEGSIVFLPREDTGKLTDLHREQARARKITLAPVANLAEAVDLLAARGILPRAPEGAATLPRTRRWPWIIAVCALLGYLAGYFAAYPLSRNLLESGRYEWAETLVKPARFLYLFDRRIAFLQQALDQPVEIKAELRSQTGEGEEEVIPFTQRTRSRLALKGQEMWSLRLKASQPLFIYLFLRDEVDELRRIFPDEVIPRDNLLPAGQEWVFPPPGYWRPVSSGRGREILILTASRWPCKDLEGRVTWRESRTLMEHLVWRDRQGEGAWVLRLALDPARP